MKHYIYVILLVLMSKSVYAQVDAEYLRTLWCERPNNYPKPQTQLENKAAAFEYQVNSRLTQIIQKSRALGLSMSVEGIDDSQIWKMRQLSYRRGSLSPKDRTLYEKEITAILNQYEMNISAVEKQRKDIWRQENPLEARIEDAEKSAADAEYRAEMARKQAEEKERAARLAEQNALNAENRARQKEYEARQLEERARQLEWQAQQAENRAREAERRNNQYR